MSTRPTAADARVARHFLNRLRRHYREQGRLRGAASARRLTTSPPNDSLSVTWRRLGGRRAGLSVEPVAAADAAAPGPAHTAVAVAVAITGITAPRLRRPRADTPRPSPLAANHANP